MGRGLSNVLSFGAFVLILAVVGYVLACGCEEASVSGPPEVVPRVAN